MILLKDNNTTSDIIFAKREELLKKHDLSFGKSHSNRHSWCSRHGWQKIEKKKATRFRIKNVTRKTNDCT